MASPITPSQLLAAIPSVASGICTRFKQFLNFPYLVWLAFSHERDEQGQITAAYCAEIVACTGGTSSGGGGGVGTGGLAAPVISASDGDFADRVRISWNAITGAATYQVYRNTANSATTAVLVGTVSTNVFDDLVANPNGPTVGTNFYYWVRAVDSGGLTSAFSNGDIGYASAALAAVSDLLATQGFTSALDPGRYIYLSWTPVANATAWDIYRNTTNDFTSATKIGSSIVPFDNSASIGTGPEPMFVDNGTDLLYQDAPPDGTAVYYYWVVGRKTTSPFAAGTQSNSASGWAEGFGDGTSLAGMAFTLQSSFNHTVAVGTRARIWFQGAGAGGAGGTILNGSGGGGGPGVCWGEFPVAAGGVFQIISTPEADTGHAANNANGTDAPKMELQYKPPAGAFATIMTIDGAKGGLFNASANGAGGAGGTAVNNSGAIVNGGTHTGWAGLAGLGNKGGRGGHSFGSYRTPPAHYDGFGLGNWTGDFDGGGGGSAAYSNGAIASLATGGSGLRTWAKILIA